MSKTALFTQLSEFRLKEKRGITPRDRKKSILFESNVAGDLDLETLNEIGLEGLCALEKLDERFSEFRSTIFSNESKNVDRLLLTEEMNNLIHNEIAHFLRLVSPSVMRRDSLKALEWLVRKFRIDEFEIQEVFGCVLPYHDSWVFSRVINILQIQEGSKLSFLKKFQQAGIPVPRDTIVKLMASDTSLIDFIIGLVKNTKDHSIRNRKLNTFAAVAITQYIETSTLINEDQARNIMFLLMPLQKDLRSDICVEIAHVSYMCIATLSKKVRLSGNVINGLVELAVSEMVPDVSDVVMKYIIILLSISAEKELLSNKVISILIQDINFEKLINIVREYCANYCLPIIFRSLLNLISNSYDNLKTYKPVIVQLVNEAKKDSFIMGEISGMLVPFLKSSSEIEQNLVPYFCSIFGGPLQNKDEKAIGYINNSSSEDEVCYNKILNSDLLLSVFINKDDPKVKLLAVKALVKRIELNYTCNYVDPSVYSALLREEDEEILKDLIKIKEKLLEVVPLRDLKTALENVIYSEHSYEVRVMYLEFILGICKVEDIDLEFSSVIAMLFLLDVKNMSLSNMAIASINEIDNLRMILGTLSMTKKAISNFHNDPECNVAYLCVEEISKDTIIENPKVREFWLNAMGSKYSKLRLLALSVVSFLAMNGKKGTYWKYSHFFRECLSVVRMNMNEELRAKILDCPLKDKEQVMSTCLKSVFLNEYSDNTNVVEALLIICLAQFLISAQDEEDGIVSEIILTLAPIADDQLVSDNLYEVPEVLSSILKPLEGDVSFFIGLCLKNFFLNDLDLEKATKQVVSLFYIKKHLESDDNCYDYQLILILLIIMLQNEVEILRHFSLECLKVLKSKYEILKSKKFFNKNIVFGYDVLYGPSTKNFAYMTYNTCFELITYVLNNSAALLSCHVFILEVIHSLYNLKESTTWKNEIVSFLLSGVSAICVDEAKSLLINSLNYIDTSKKFKILQNHLLEIIEESSLKPLDPLKGKIFSLILASITRKTAPRLLNHKSSRSFEIFNKALNTPGKEGDLVDIQLLTVESVNPFWFHELSDDSKAEIFDSLTTLASGKGTFASVKKSKMKLRTLPLSYKLFQQQINSLKDGIKSLSFRAQKRANISSEFENDTGYIYNRIISLFELILVGSDTISDRLRLIAPSFELLGVVVGLNSITLVSFEYIKQIILSVLLDLLKKAKEDNVYVDSSWLRADYVVSCTRTSDNLQTQNTALLLLSHIAEIHHEGVLMNIMPVFTFIGSNIVRKDDNYNFYVVHKMLEAVLPALVSDKNGPRISKITLCIDVFVGAFFHIPENRRIRLFTTLVYTLGEETYLYLVLINFIRRTVRNKPKRIFEMINFCVSMFFQFKLRSCLTALIDIINIVKHIRENSTIEKLNEDLTPEIAHFITRGTTRFLSNIRLEIINFIHNIVSADSFADLHLSENVLMGVDLQEKLFEEAVSCVEIFREHEVLAAKLDRIIERLSSLMTLGTFAKSIGLLLRNDNCAIKAKGVSLMHSRLASHIKSSFSEEDTNHILYLTKEVVAFIHNDSPIVIEAALNYISALAKEEKSSCSLSLEGIFKNTMKTVADDIISMKKEDRQDVNLMTCMLKCLTRICARLGKKCIFYLQTVMDAANTALDIMDVSSWSPILNLYRTLIRVSPEFMTCYPLRVLNASFTALDKSLPLDENSPLSNISNSAINEVIQTVYTSDSLEAMHSIFRDIVYMDYRVLIKYIDVISKLILKSTEENTLHQNQTNIFRILIVALDYRIVLNDREGVDTVESRIISSIIQLIKGSDTRAELIFTKIVEWSNMDDGRNVTMYHFLAELLKEGYASFYLCLLDKTILVLQNYDYTQDKHILWRYVIESMKEFFEHDIDTPKESLSLAAVALTKQIDNLNRYEEHEELLSFTICELFHALTKKNICGELIKLLLTYTRNKETKIKTSSIRILRNIFLKYGKEVLPFIPESIVHISELLDQDDKAVERECQLLIKAIESSTGQSLEQYF